MENTNTYNYKNNLKNVFRLLKRVVIFGLAFVLAMVLALMLTGYICREGRLGTTYKKQARLVSLSSPKMVLIGGSNLTYGINSKMLQDSIDMPVVNMGIQQSIGLKHMLDEVRESLHKDDVLVILVEIGGHIAMPVEGMTNIARITSIYPKAARHLNWKQWYNAAMYSGTALIQNYRDIQVILNKKIRKKPTFYESCDEFGDYHGHKGLSSKFKPVYRDYSDDIIHDNGSKALIKEIQQQATKQDFQVLIGFTPSAASMSDSLFFGKTQAQLPTEIVIGNIVDYILPDSFFYDSPDHLIYSKRDMRTRMLIKDLGNSHE